MTRPGMLGTPSVKTMDAANRNEAKKAAIGEV
jgi:hypothetical protein